MNLLLSQIFSSPWALDKERAAAYAAILYNLMSGNPIAQDEDSADTREKNRSYVINRSQVGEEQRYSLRNTEIPEGSIAVIPIRSEIMKYDQPCGPRGSLSIVADLKLADENPRIKSILIVMDSPGGQVAHTNILSDQVKNSKTPIIAYVEGYATSAAYWIVSGASKIIASSDLDRIGSIGTMMFFADMQPYWEEMGVKFHEFYASKSKDKNRDYNDIVAGKYDDYIKTVLDVYNEKFISSIKANRPGVDPAVFTGKVYFAPQAIMLGLIDEIGTMEYALEQADITTEEVTNDEIPENMKMSKAWGAILKIFGKDPEQLQEENLTQEMMQDLNDRIVTLNEKMDSQSATIKEMEEAYAAEKQAHDQAKADLSASQKATEDLHAEFEAYKAGDATGETGAKKKKDESPKGKDQEFAHNKAAEAYLGKK